MEGTNPDPDIFQNKDPKHCAIISEFASLDQEERKCKTRLFKESNKYFVKKNSEDGLWDQFYITMINLYMVAGERPGLI